MELIENQTIQINSIDLSTFAEKRNFYKLTT